MSDTPAHVLCDSIAECQAVLHAHEGGTLTDAVHCFRRTGAVVLGETKEEATNWGGLFGIE